MAGEEKKNEEPRLKGMISDHHNYLRDGEQENTYVQASLKLKPTGNSSQKDGRGRKK